MPLTEDQILLEVGSEVLDELTDKEKTSILNKYSSGEEKLAAMKVFYLAALKYKPTYKMGSAYEELSSKYKRYWDIYCHLAKSLSAGVVTGGSHNNNYSNNVSANNSVEVDRWKWPGQIL